MKIGFSEIFRNLIKVQNTPTLEVIYSKKALFIYFIFWNLIKYDPYNEDLVGFAIEMKFSIFFLIFEKSKL